MATFTWWGEPGLVKKRKQPEQGLVVKKQPRDILCGSE